MTPIDERLARMIAELKCGDAELSVSLRMLLRQLRHADLLLFSLESVHGPVYSDNPVVASSAGNENNLAALPALGGDNKNKKRFFCTMSEQCWEVVTAFKLGAQPFFTTLTLDISDTTGAALRSGLFKLADYFTVQCRRLLQEFLNGLLLQAPPPGVSGGLFPFEKGVLRQVIDFSHDVQCAVLLDDDGFIVHSEGTTGAVDELGSALSRLFRRSGSEPCMLSGAEYTAITLADEGFTIRIGRLFGTTLSFAVSVGGMFALATANFLHKVASEALCAYALQAGVLWGVSFTPPPGATRLRKSWFTAPQLVAHGKYVGKIGGTTFHMVECQVLAKTDPSKLAWFDARAGAIANGMRPCTACNP